MNGDVIVSLLREPTVGKKNKIKEKVIRKATLKPGTGLNCRDKPLQSESNLSDSSRGGCLLQAPEISPVCLFCPFD